MKVVLLGAAGMLGRAVCASAPHGAALLPFARAELDLTDDAAVLRALNSRPDWVINCAAWTWVDAAEDQEAEATLVNGTDVGRLGEAAQNVGAHVLHLSTEYVFDGTLDRPYREGDTPNPVGAYGRSKVAGERALAESGCEWIVVRTPWLYDGGPSFVRTMWNRALQGSSIGVAEVE